MPWSLIFVIIEIFLKLPGLIKTIMEIVELIRMLKAPAEKEEAKAQLKAVLMKYRDTKKSDKQQVAERGPMLQKDLEKLKEKLKKA